MTLAIWVLIIGGQSPCLALISGEKLASWKHQSESWFFVFYHFDTTFLGYDSSFASYVSEFSVGHAKVQANHFQIEQLICYNGFLV